MKPNITLFLGGMLVSGTLISGKEYFNEFGDAIDTALSRRFGEKPTGEFRQPFSVLAGIYDEQTGDKDTDDPPPSYIHLRLRSIRICGAQRVRSETGILWRGRLSQ